MGSHLFALSGMQLTMKNGVEVDRQMAKGRKPAETKKYLS
jgi:hypothetical protein